MSPRWPLAALLFTLAAALGLASCAPAGEKPPGLEPSPGTPLPPAPAAPFVRVLGTAQDGGLPHAACSCGRCELARADPRHRRLVVSLAIVVPPRVYLIDATPDLIRQLDLLNDVRAAPPGRVDRAPVDGVFLTHAHMGHYLGLAHLGYEAVHTTDLPVWASPRMADFLSLNAPWSHLVERGEIELRVLLPGGEVDLGAGVRVGAIAVPHRDEDTDTLGFRIRGPNRTVLYVPDTDSWRQWEPPIEAALDGIDVALLDGTFYSLDELPGRDVASIPHPLIADSMTRLRDRARSGVEVLFTHLNHSNPALDPDGAARRTLEEQGFRLAAEGEEFPL